MSKKSQSYQVKLNPQEDLVEVLINDELIGTIQEEAGLYSGLIGDQSVINSAKSVDEALQAILASFNLYH
ncbi:DUF2969 family protein [Eupransor demetentiae]|uniref:DUF2969 domain-containing protein n=1 Tax=Eupransor demetentiae TaxID=3109584 RepID=A0ABM9N6D3_9LACO|nr:hypothetical protein R54876_GBNLAHCA_01362 [Lactobacillaceae bacterium LMG 33000]